MSSKKQKEIVWVWIKVGCRMLGRLSTSARSLMVVDRRVGNGGVSSSGSDCQALCLCLGRKICRLGDAWVGWLSGSRCASLEIPFLGCSRVVLLQLDGSMLCMYVVHGAWAGLWLCLFCVVLHGACVATLYQGPCGGQGHGHVCR